MTNGMKIARQLIAEEREKQTGFLDLGNLGLTELPEELFGLTELRGLNLGPPDMGEDYNFLETYYLAPNALKAIPASFSALRSLEVLVLRGNPIGDLRGLEELIKLQSLDCFGTALGELHNLPPLPALENLDLGTTLISDLSPIVGRNNLKTLSLFKTRVTELSPLRSLIVLQQLDAVVKYFRTPR